MKKLDLVEFQNLQEKGGERGNKPREKRMAEDGIVGVAGGEVSDARWLIFVAPFSLVTEAATKLSSSSCALVPMRYPASAGLRLPLALKEAGSSASRTAFPFAESAAFLGAIVVEAREIGSLGERRARGGRR